jgi:hypothetical protein
MASRGRIDLELFVENVADLSQIQLRKGDRKAATEMALQPGENDRRPEVELFRQLQRLRSPNVAATDRAKTLARCRQAAEALGKQTDLQPGAIRTPAQPERQARRMSEFERDLWERAAAKYPVKGRTPEIQAKIERAIKRKVREHNGQQAAKTSEAQRPQPVVPPPAQGREHERGRGSTMGR